MHFRDLRIVVIALWLIGGPCLAAEDFLRQGIAAYQQGKYTEAIGLFGAAKGTQAENPLLHYYMGNTLIHMKAPADALREYKLARDLSPGTRMASLCDAAIASLEQAKAATQPKVFQTKPAEQKWRMPRIIFYTCDCKLCASAEPIARDIYAENKNNLVVLYVSRGARDERSMGLSKKYDLSLHPTVLFINEYGVLTKRFTELVNSAQLRKEAVSFAQSTAPPSPSNADEKNVATYRKEQMGELFDRVREQEKKLSAERIHIDEETKAKIESISRPSTRSFSYLDSRSDYQTLRAKIIEDAAKEKEKAAINTAQLKMDFFMAAEKNIEKEEQRLKHLTEMSKTRRGATP